MRIDCPLCGAAEAVEIEWTEQDNGDGAWFQSTCGPMMVDNDCGCEISGQTEQRLLDRLA